MPPPPDRPDILLPDDDDYMTVLKFIEGSLTDVRKRPATAKLIVECGLTEDEVRMLIVYKLEYPYPVYRLLNALLMCDRRDPEVIAKVGPAFTLLFRAMEKLPRVRKNASRAVIVNDIPSLVKLYDNYKSLNPQLCFWGFSSFTTNDAVMNAFLGVAGAKGLVYSCPALTGVDMEPFKPDGLQAESELLPLPPAMFNVHSSVNVMGKVVVTLEQLPNEDYMYVVPTH
jgi:hypothetical protein